MSKNLGLKHENKYFAALSWSKFMFEILGAFKLMAGHSLPYITKELELFIG